MTGVGADWLLDTDILIDVLKGHMPTMTALAAIPESDAIRCSVVTVAELWAGVPDSDGPAESALTRLLGSMSVVDIDPVIAGQAGRYRQRYGRTAGMSLPDALVAASAHSRSAALVTRNARHFPLPDVAVLTPEALAARRVGEPSPGPPAH